MQANCSYKVLDGNGSVRYYSVAKTNESNNSCTVSDLANPGGPKRRISLDRHTVLKQLRACYTHKAIRRPQSPTQLYILKTGRDTYKIGCTSDLATRMRAGRTWCSRMSLVASRSIPTRTQKSWRYHEKKMLRFVAARRCNGGGNEVFHLDASSLRRAVQYMRRMCLT